MNIVKNHRTDFEICLPKKSADVRRAAEILAKYIEKISGCSLQLTNITGSACVKNKFILDTEPFLMPLRNAGNLGDEGFVIAEQNGAVYIYGASPDGLIYGVYEFLEEYCGCLWLTSKDDFVPESASVSIPDNTFNRQLPAMNYREVYYNDTWNPDFAEKMRLNGNAWVKKEGAKPQFHKKWGFWCHSTFNLVPPDEYFDSHPEYFSMYEGKRVKGNQLCFSNDEIPEIAIQNLKKFMDKDPEAVYWSVSQMDNGHPCECEKCRALNEKAGSPIGSIIHFVNKIADAFPDKIISTLSYQFSRKAPEKIELRDNVHIMLCDIECDRSRPMTSNPKNKSFVDDITKWHDYCENIFLWDYDIQYSNLVSPFPNLRILAPNMRFFYESNVRSIFNQGNAEIGGDLWALRAYMLSKLSWNPYCDIKKHVNNFISAYYGKAAPYVHEYLDLIHDEMEKSDKGLFIYNQPMEQDFLSKELLDRYESILSDAKKAVEGDPVKTLRIDEIIMTLAYARLKSKRYGDETEHENYREFFRNTARLAGVQKVEEWTETVDMFLEKF